MAIRGHVQTIDVHKTENVHFVRGLESPCYHVFRTDVVPENPSEARLVGRNLGNVSPRTWEWHKSIQRWGAEEQKSLNHKCQTNPIWRVEILSHGNLLSVIMLVISPSESCSTHCCTSKMDGLANKKNQMCGPIGALIIINLDPYPICQMSRLKTQALH